MKSGSRPRNYSEAQKEAIGEVLRTGFSGIEPEPHQVKKANTNRSILAAYADELFKRIAEGYSLEQVYAVLARAGYQSTLESFRRLVQTMKVERTAKPKASKAAKTKRLRAATGAKKVTPNTVSEKPALMQVETAEERSEREHPDPLADMFPPVPTRTLPPMAASALGVGEQLVRRQQVFGPRK